MVQNKPAKTEIRPAILVTMRLGRPSTILITAGSSNICPLPRPPLHLGPLPRCHGVVRHKYCGFSLGGDGGTPSPPLGNEGLGSGAGGGVGGSGSPNETPPSSKELEVPCGSRSRSCRKTLIFLTSLHPPCKSAGKNLTQFHTTGWQ